MGKWNKLEAGFGTWGGGEGECVGRRGRREGRRGKGRGREREREREREEVVHLHCDTQREMRE